MPTRTSIYWSFQKDVSVFDSLLRTDQKVIMQLDNLSDSIVTGIFNITITAIYYDDHVALTPANKIYPLSSQSSSKNQTSVFSLPDQNATVSVTLPRNMARAVVSVIASGNGAEEFWYKHVPTEYTGTFNNSAIRAYSPWREVQLLVDGNIAGVSWPFPVIFTGGISPGLWVSVVGIDTYDIPNFEIDISPWLGKLCDGDAHTFELKVVGWDSKTMFGTVASNWYVAGSIFVWVDNTTSQTVGSAIVTEISSPLFHFSPRVTESLGTNTSLHLEKTASRDITHTATIINSSPDSHPRPRIVTWKQSLFYTNTQNYTAKGYNVMLSQHTTGSSTFSSFLPDTAPITNTFSYPLFFTTANDFPVDPRATNKSSIYASLDRSKISSTTPILSCLSSPSTLWTPEVLNTKENGTCLYFWNDTYYENAGAIDPAKGTIGATEQWYSFTGRKVSYRRHVMAVDGYEPELLVDEVVEKTMPIKA